MVTGEDPVDLQDLLSQLPPSSGTGLDATVEVLLERWPPRDIGATRTRLIEALDRESEPMVFERSVELLIGHQGARDLLGGSLVEAMIRRADQHTEPREAYMAAVALEGLVSLLLESDAGNRRLDAVLLMRNASPTADQTWAQTATRMAGLAYAHWNEQTLRAALKQCLDALQDHPSSGGDAAVERAHVQLIDAFDAPDYQALQEGLRDAEQRFSEVAVAEENRIDAEFMANVLGAVRGFGLGADAAVIAAAAQRAQSLLSERGLYGRSEALPPLSRRRIEAAWARLVHALAEAAVDIDASLWSNGVRTVSLLIDAIEASATVLVAPRHQSDVRAAVGPRIDAVFIRNMTHRQMLAQIVAREEIEPQRRDVALALLARASDSSQGLGLDEPLEALLGADLHTFAEVLGPTAVARVRDRAAVLLRPHAKARDVQWWETYERILDSLADAPDYAGDLTSLLRALVGDLLDFVSHCSRSQLNVGGGILSYLGDANAHERRMADHLVSWLEVLGGWTVSSEVPNEGSGGRVDVRVGLGADRFIVECKRDRTSVDKGSIDPYVAQTDRYLGTSLRVGALAILDLSSKDTGSARGLDSSAWVVDVPAVDQSAPARKVMCFVVPGNRAATPATVGRNTLKR